MIKAYPTFIAKAGEDYLVYVPDMDIYTEGSSIENAMEMARDAIGLKGEAMENEHLLIPDPKGYEEALKKAKQDTEDFDYSQGILTMVDVDFRKYRRTMGKNRYVYPAVFTYAPEQKIAVVFPDLDCATCGENDDDALISARELLGCVLSGLKEDGEVIPEPTALSEVETGENEKTVLIEFESSI